MRLLGGVLAIGVVCVLVACEGKEGPMGPAGPQGESGDEGRIGDSPSIDEIVAAVLDSIHALPEGSRPIEELPLSFEGTGTQVTAQVVLVANTLYVLRAEFALDSYLIVRLIDGVTGDQVDHLLNESSGTAEASTSFNVRNMGNYLFEIDNVRGQWRITIDKS